MNISPGRPASTLADARTPKRSSGESSAPSSPSSNKFGGGRRPVAQRKRSDIKPANVILEVARIDPGPAETMSIDVLKGLFEQHFHAPPERVQPLQGQLGGSGRVIVRLTGNGQNNAQSNGPSAIGILYDVREENV